MVRKNWTFVSDYYEDEWDTPIRTYIAQIDTHSSKITTKYSLVNNLGLN